MWARKFKGKCRSIFGLQLTCFAACEKDDFFVWGVDIFFLLDSVHETKPKYSTPPDIMMFLITK
jgi:hypothetical protein